MSELLPESIDLTVTSPPYDSLRCYGDACPEWNFEKFKTVAEELFRVTKVGGVVVWIVADATENGSETGTSFAQALYFKEIGFNLHDTMIWNKGGFSAVGALKSRYAPVFEYMFILTKGRLKTFNPINDHQNKVHDKIVKKTKRLPDGSTVRGKPYVANKLGRRFNIWDIPPQRQRGESTHPAPFPKQLAIDHIMSWSNEGDLVLDPFLGSGTTAVACLEARRRFIGIEVNKEYCKIAIDRIQNVA